jgi:hypothetical protein
MAEDPIKAVLHFAHALNAPRIRESAARLAELARDGGWSHEEYLAAVLSARWQPGKLPRRRPVRGRPAFRHESHWKTSTSIPNTT